MSLEAPKLLYSLYRCKWENEEGKIKENGEIMLKEVIERRGEGGARGRGGKKKKRRRKRKDRDNRESREKEREGDTVYKYPGGRKKIYI